MMQPGWRHRLRGGESPPGGQIGGIVWTVLVVGLLCAGLASPWPNGPAVATARSDADDRPQDTAAAAREFQVGGPSPGGPVVSERKQEAATPGVESQIALPMEFQVGPDRDVEAAAAPEVQVLSEGDFDLERQPDHVSEADEDDEPGGGVLL